MTATHVSYDTKQCRGCGRTLNNHKNNYCSKLCYVRSVEHRRRLREWHAMRKAAGLPPLPMPAEIASECLEIQKTWSDAERPVTCAASGCRPLGIALRAGSSFRRDVAHCSEKGHH